MRDLRRGSASRQRVGKAWATGAAIAAVSAAVAGAVPAVTLGASTERAYEMVSPPDKNGGQVTLGSGSIRASSLGTAVVFDSNVGSSETLGTGGIALVTFRSDRGEASWTTQSLMPAQDVNAYGLFHGPNFGWFSPDLSYGLLEAKDPPLVPGAPQGVLNLYLTDGHGGSPVLVTPGARAPLIGGGFNEAPPIDTSTDRTRVAFQGVQMLTDDAPPQSGICTTFGVGCQPRLYMWDHGTVHLAGILPDGTPVAGPSVAGAPEGAALVDTNQALSDDGSRLYFSTPEDGLLYLRRDNTATAWVSQSEASAPDATPSPTAFSRASADGVRAVFTTDEHLLDVDQDTSTDLYLYTDSADPALDANLTLVSHDDEPVDGSAAAVDGVIGMSRDGSHVYFVARSQLVVDQPPDGLPKLYLWEDGDVRYIASLVSTAFDDDERNWNPRAVDRASRVSADGRYVVFTTRASLVPGSDSAGHQTVYRYDAVADDLACVSCPSTGPVTADSSLNFPGAAATRLYSAYEARALSTDSQRVFFNTPQSLVLEDSNGRVDAYVWDGGTVHLISSGQSERDSYFVDASANGDDAYFVTRERLVGWDTDSLLDVYDARVGGGLPEPVVRGQCAGESCQGALAEAPDGATPGSDGALGHIGGRPKPRPASFSLLPPGPREKTRRERAGWIRLRVRVSTGGRLTAQASAGSRTLTSASRRSAGAGLTTLALKLPATARDRLRDTGRLRITVTVRFSRAPHAKHQTITLGSSAGVAGARGVSGR